MQINKNAEKLIRQLNNQGYEAVSYTHLNPMNELALKYGCNPNQKPSRIFMQDGKDLPVEVLLSLIHI